MTRCKFENGDEYEVTNDDGRGPISFIEKLKSGSSDGSFVVADMDRLYTEALGDNDGAVHSQSNTEG